MAAGQRVVDERERKARIRKVAEHIAVDVEDRRRLRHLAAPAPLCRGLACAATVMGDGAVTSASPA